MDPELPDDVVTDILERVPDSISLFRCSVVCKQWRRLVADPVFLRRRWPENTSSRASFLGCFIQRRRTNFSAQRSTTSRPSQSRAPAFIPKPDSAVLGPRRRLLTSFVRDDEGVFDKAKPLLARGGLILVRVAPRSSERNTILRLCVCTLLTGSRERLPVLDAPLLKGDGVLGYGLATAADYNDDAEPPHHQLAHGYSTLFQVLLIGFGQDGHLYLFKFSSAVAGSRRWSIYDCTRSTGGVKFRGPYHGCSNATIARGTVRWFFHGNNDPTGNNPSLYTLDVSVSTGRISATVISSNNALPYRIRHNECAYVMNVQYGSATKVDGSFDYTTAVPCEINWPMFFMSRLGVQI